MNTFNEFTISGSKLYMILNEAQLFKNYIKTQTVQSSSLTATDILEGDNLSIFGAEIFQFWLEGFTVGKEDVNSFIEFAQRINIPVVDHDINNLSWIGRAIYAVWVEAIKVHKV